MNNKYISVALLAINLIYVDLFCGAGGTSTGVESAVVNGEKCAIVAACVNHDKNAIISHSYNHPETKHFTEDIRTLNVSEDSELVKHIKSIRKKYPFAKVVVWASLECTNHSKAKGGMSRDADSRTLAEHLFRYIDALKPDSLQIENVEEFLIWGPLIEKVIHKDGTSYCPLTSKCEPIWIPDPERKGEYYNQWVEKVKIPLMGYKSESWDSTVPNERIYAEIKRVTQDQIFFGANYYKEIIGIPQKPPRRNEYDKFLIDHPVGWIIWDKLNGNNDFNDCEIIYTSLDFHSHIIYYMWSGMMQGIYCGTDRDKANVQQGDKSLNVKRFHPTQKPVPIYKYLLTHFVKQDFKVLELGFGSASLAIACHDYEINLLTCENNLEYYKNGVNRFKFHSMLEKLIFPA